MTGLRVHPLPQKPFILHLLANKPTRDADLLSSYNYLHDAHEAEDASVLMGVLLTSCHTVILCRVCVHTTCCPFSSCLARMDASRPSMCPRASITTVCMAGYRLS